MLYNDRILPHMLGLKILLPESIPSTGRVDMEAVQQKGIYFDTWLLVVSGLERQ